MEAVFTNDLGRAGRLLESGVDPNFTVPLRAIGEHTPLTAALNRPFLREPPEVMPTIDLLLKHGARPPMLNSWGNSALAYAHHPTLFMRFLRYYDHERHREMDGSTTLHIAARKGYNDVVEQLLRENAADVNARDNRGETILHQALHPERVGGLTPGEVEKRRRLINLFHAHGGNLHAKDKYGQTALDIARYLRNQDLIRDLEGLGRDQTRKRGS